MRVLFAVATVMVIATSAGLLAAQWWPFGSDESADLRVENQRLRSDNESLARQNERLSTEKQNLEDRLTELLIKITGQEALARENVRLTGELDTSKAFLGVLVATATGATATTVTGRTIVANLLKFIPGGGQVVGGAISAATAGALTSVLGEIYLASLVAVFTRTGGKTPEIDAVTREFTERVKAATDDSFFKKFKSTVGEWLGFGQSQ